MSARLDTPEHADGHEQPGGGEQAETKKPTVSDSAMPR